jgi:hypothetical protein
LEESTGKWFPASNSAKEVRDKLLGACRRLGVRVQYNAGLQGLQQLPGGGWRLELAGGGGVEARRVILATGGLSFPKVGLRLWLHLFLTCQWHSLHCTIAVSCLIPSCALSLPSPAWHHRRRLQDLGEAWALFA